MATTATLAVAGCSDDGGGGGDDDDDDEATTESPFEEMGSHTNELEGDLAFAAYESEVDDGDFVVTVSIENVGDQTTDIWEYDYQLDVYDESGTNLSNGTAMFAMSDTEVEPGETASLDLNPQIDDPSAVTSYEITLSCGAFSDGAYCE